MLAQNLPSVFFFLYCPAFKECRALIDSRNVVRESIRNPIGLIRAKRKSIRKREHKDILYLEKEPTMHYDKKYQA